MVEASWVSRGWEGHRFDRLGSTMDCARVLAENNAPDRTLVRADMQSDGRGRHGRHWVSETGNLYITAIFQENRPLGDCAQLSFVAALALYDVIDICGTALKWPNDVLIHGAKVAGILLEGGGAASAPWILVGIGVNVQSAPQGTPYPATDLRSEGLVLDADALCLELTKSLDHWREIWHRKGSSILHATWLERAYGVKGRISVQTRQNRFEGIFEGLDREGRLVLRDFEGKKHDISAGDVYFS